MQALPRDILYNCDLFDCESVERYSMAFDHAKKSVIVSNLKVNIKRFFNGGMMAEERWLFELKPETVFVG